MYRLIYPLILGILLLNGLLLVGVLWMGQAVPPSLEIAYASDRDGNFEIYRMDVDHQLEIQLTHNDAPDWQPVWSPDGTRIIFTSQRDNNAEIYIMNADGSNVQRLTNNIASDFSPVWSPDGSQIAFVTARYESTQIMVMDAQGGNAHPITQYVGGATTPAWSPDGQWIAFVSTQDIQQGHTHIYLMDSSGQQVRQVAATAGIDGAPAWTPDGRLIFVSDWDNFALHLATLDSTMPTLILASNTSHSYYNPAVSSDGRWLAYSFFSADHQADIYVVDMTCAARPGGCDSPAHRLTSAPGVNMWPSWRP
jgi:Tol biopolymer transport system component